MQPPSKSTKTKAIVMMRSTVRSGGVGSEAITLEVSAAPTKRRGNRDLDPFGEAIRHEGYQSDGTGNQHDEGILAAGTSVARARCPVRPLPFTDERSCHVPVRWRALQSGCAKTLRGEDATRPQDRDNRTVLGSATKSGKTCSPRRPEKQTNAQFVAVSVRQPKAEPTASGVGSTFRWRNSIFLGAPMANAPESH